MVTGHNAPMFARTLCTRAAPVVASLLLFGCHAGTKLSSDVAPAVTDVRVVIFVIDGPRWSETFGDSLHAHIPGMWNTLRPQGTLCTNFRNADWTLTIPGHATMLTGVWQHLNNQGLERPGQPTLFEYYRKERNAPETDALIVSMKEKLESCAFGLDPAYGAAYRATPDFSPENDVQTFKHLITHLDTDSPHMVMASFSQVDLAGHDSTWAGYLRHIEIVDSLAVLTWKHLQASAAYAGKTYMFITSDHGRHDDKHGGFQNHGCKCDGCRHIPFLALGPTVRKGYECTTEHTQQDVCKMVASLLGIDAPQAQGESFAEIFTTSDEDHARAKR